MKEEEGTHTDWEWGTEYPELVGKPKVLDYDYGLTEKNINILDFVPASVLTSELEFQELTSSPSLELGSHGMNPIQVKVEKQEPCAAAEAIEANIPAPDLGLLSKWRTFISVAYYHPNILVHKDVACLKELFQLLGEDLDFKSVNVMIDLGKTVEDYKPIPYLCPPPSSSQKQMIFSFAHVKDFFIDSKLKVCIVTKYGINEIMKKAVTEMVAFLFEYPEALYLEVYGFILDFLLKFGVQSDVIIDAVMRTQARRRKGQRPASVLIMKKANSLGKGKKEFLQQKLLESPEEKYRPIVPIISEPPPVRNLRNRRTGGLEPNCTTPIGNTEVKMDPPYDSYQNGLQRTSNEVQRSSTGHGTTNTTLVFAVKRKLFNEESRGDEPSKAESTRSNLNSTTTIKKDCSCGNTSRKKRYYVRRESSVIERPFTCSICPDRSFAYKGNLVLHMKKKHQNNTSAPGKYKAKRQENRVPAFTCPVCLQGYASKYKCKAHMQRVHPELGDWPPICNEEALNPPKKTIPKTTRKNNGSRISSGTLVRRNTRRSLVPLSQTQNSSSYEPAKSSHSYPKTQNSYCIRRRDSMHARKQQFSFPLRSGAPITLNKDYSTFSHIRTRQQFRATIK